MGKFKKHMVKYWDDDGTFKTMCGITEACSEDFYDDHTNTVEYGNEKETTCKNCLKSFKSESELTSRDFEEIGLAVINSHKKK